MSLALEKTTSSNGFKGSGPMNLATAEDWIRTFFFGGAEQIIHYYADDFVFEDLTLFQTIDNKEDLYRAFLPFNDNGPDAPTGVHDFDVIRYDGGLAGEYRSVVNPRPERWTEEEWATWSKDTLAGVELDYDEWAHFSWVWRAKHNSDDFLGLKGAKGRTTYVRGQTFHVYKDRKIVRDFTQWNFREVAIQLGAFPPPDKFWLA